MKPFGFFHKLSKQLSKKTGYFASRFSMKKIWFFFIFLCSNSLLDKNRQPILSLKQLGKMKIVTAEIVSQMDPVYELNWLTSKLQSWNSLLGNFKFLTNWSGLWIELKHFKATKIKYLLKKTKLFKIWFTR